MEEFIDERDENHYKIVKIGNLIWFAENLRYEGVLHYAPDNDTDNIDNYGCLYDWETAKKACPDGWRLPTKEEFEDLLKLTSANDDSSNIRASSWEIDSDNSSDFSALPAGYCWCSSEFYDFGSCAFFWSYSPFDRDTDYAYSLDVNLCDAFVYNDYCSNAFSVRCVKEIE